MAKLRKIGVLSLAKLQGATMVFVGLLAGILYSFGGLAIDTLVSFEIITSDETPGLSYGTILAFGALIGMPILFGIYGFITGAIGAFIYNLGAKWTGGLEVDLE